MRLIDRVLQRWRARMAWPFIPERSKVLDIGCHQGEFLASLGNRIGPSIGLDPLAEPKETARYQLISDLLRPSAPFPDDSFDVIVMLATLEHIRDKDSLAEECYRLLRPGGRVVITVPSNAVDIIIACLRWLRLLDGMSLEEHHGFDPRLTPGIFARPGFILEHRRRFQLGLNYLFVLQKPLEIQPFAAQGQVGMAQ